MLCLYVMMEYGAGVCCDSMVGLGVKGIWCCGGCMLCWYWGLAALPFHGVML